MSAGFSLLEIVEPVIGLVPRQELRESLIRAFAGEPDAVGAVEHCFELLPTQAWPPELLRTFANSWKATHLKMLAIYGLSCRLQRLAAGAEPARYAALHLAAARNAETSYEDLGLDYDAQTHAELYDNFAEALTGGDGWQLGRYRLPQAHQFSRWVYRNMVVGDISDGLLTNMFSEIYNHCEYSLALRAFESYFTEHSPLSPEERAKALTYIRAHVEDDTEADHFLVVVDALDQYGDACGSNFDAARAEHVFRTYLRKLAEVMRDLAGRMEREISGEALERVATAAV